MKTLKIREKERILSVPSPKSFFVPVFTKLYFFSNMSLRNFAQQGFEALLREYSISAAPVNINPR